MHSPARAAFRRHRPGAVGRPEQPGGFTVSSRTVRGDVAIGAAGLPDWTVVSCVGAVRSRSLFCYAYSGSGRWRRSAADRLKAALDGLLTRRRRLWAAAKGLGISGRRPAASARRRPAGLLEPGGAQSGKVMIFSQVRNSSSDRLCRRKASSRATSPLATVTTSGQIGSGKAASENMGLTVRDQRRSRAAAACFECTREPCIFPERL
jgi:hypothetical protein